MAFNYVIVENHNSDKLYEVVETPTEQVIDSFESHDEARKFSRHLNLGGGFDGWTPAFCLTKGLIVD